MSGFEYDESAVTQEEANYQTPTAHARRAFVRDHLALTSGASVLSIGCGPGFEPAELALTGQPEHVLGVDRHPVMLARARERCPDNVSLLRGGATTLPVADGAFDATVSVQVYEYIEDFTATLLELHRVLAADGKAIVYATDWESLIRSAGDADPDRVLDVWNTHCVHPRLGSELRVVLQSAPFMIEDIVAFLIVLKQLGEDLFPQYRLEFIRGFVAPALGDDTTQAWADDLRARDKRDEMFFSLCQYSYLVTPTREN